MDYSAQFTPARIMLAVVLTGGFILVIVAIAKGVSPSSSVDGSASCPASYAQNPPLILVSLDGFRASYLSRGITPALKSLVDEGVSVPYMRPTYPTVTFPNHYTIVTGLYPESHGIISNKFYDPDLGRQFSLSNGATTEGVWWGGDPLWNTVTRQGKKSATYFWPGSDANITGIYPTYYYTYNGSIPYEDRVDQVLDWVSLPEDERPVFITLYFDEPDHNGHEFGPDSDEVTEKIIEVDGLLEQLISGLKSKNLYDCVNLIVLADHGMAGGGSSWVINLKEYITDIYDRSYVYGGAFSRINPMNKSIDERYDIMQNLSCKRPDLREYEKTSLPTRFHFSNNKRIEDIVLDLDAGRYVSTGYFNKGNHGYDNYLTPMNSLFTARGPAFKVGYVAESFQNIELYELMSHLVKVTPSDNNGTFGSLNHILKDPPIIPELPQEAPLSSPEFPDTATLKDRLDLAACDGDLADKEPWMDKLDLSDEQKVNLSALHSPWGSPQITNRWSNDSVNLSLLYHLDHITAFSDDLKIPLWSSFSLDTSFQRSNKSSWSSDFRLNQTNTPKCSDYNSFIAEDDETMLAPLFPPVFSHNASDTRIPFLISNAVPSTTQHQERWEELMEVLVERWLAFSELNVVVGPVYDLDADSLMDNIFETGSNSLLPSHWFAVVTRCTSGGHIEDCEASNLEARAFIYPTQQEISNCLTLDQYALEFSSTVSDVMRITGLTFYPGLNATERIDLTVSVHSDLW